jgi:hypothetical protein
MKEYNELCEAVHSLVNHYNAKQYLLVVKPLLEKARPRFEDPPPVVQPVAPIKKGQKK